MRKLQYKKTYELLTTLQEAAGILSSMEDTRAKARLISDIVFFVNEITQYLEGFADTSQVVSALRRLEDILLSPGNHECADVAGEVSNIKEELDAVKLERTSQEEFRAELDFSRYIDLLLQAAEDGYAIMITSMDTPCGSRNFTYELGEKLRMLGTDINLCNKWRISYCAVIDEGNKVDEKASDTHAVSISCKLDNTDVFVKSAGMQKMDSPRTCSVMINGQESAVCHRGISFVVYDKESDMVIDSVNFDTYSEGLYVMRHGISPAMREFMDSALGTVFINAGYPAFPKNNLSKNEQWILSNRIHYSMLYQDPMLPSALLKYIKEPSGILEVLEPPKSYVGVDGARHFEDCKGKYLNTENGYRRTLGQPKNFRRTIYIVGGCQILGIGARDEGTLASQLQKLLNIHAPEEAFKVENCGFALSSTDEQNEILATLRSLPLKAGDIVIGAGGQIYSYNKKLEVRPYRYGELFFDDEHVTEATHGLVAEGLLDTLKENGFFRDALKETQTYKQIHPKNYNLSAAQLSELEQYKQKLAKLYKDYSKPKDTVGAIVMNCNPFTLGHRYLIETCAKKCDMLLVFVVQEDKSFFPFADRIRLVEEGCSDLGNVCVIGSGKFILSSLTFSEYFNKAKLQDRTVDSSEDVTLFVNEIVPAANIGVRFVGTESLDTVTNQYNRTLELILTQHGIRFEEIPRIEKEGEVISASRVRKLLEERNWELIQELVPDTTLSYLKNNFCGIRAAF